MSPDRVLVAQSAASSRAASLEQFYVSASRGKRGIMVFTDDRQELKESVARFSQRLSAVEMMRASKAVRRLETAPSRIEQLKMHAMTLARSAQSALSAAVSKGRDMFARPASVQTNEGMGR